MGKILYHIRTDFDATFVRRATGEDVSADELKIIIEHLTQIHQTMFETGQSQVEIKNHLYTHVMQPIIENCKVFYPCNLPHLNWRREEPGRPRKAKRYTGVYFATHPDKPGQIKVGCAGDVYVRMRTLFHEMGKKPLTIQGFIETPEQKALESYIHAQLGRGFHESEWFPDTSALGWLEGFAS